MSIDTLEHDLAQYLANDGYEVTFKHGVQHNLFQCFVIFNGQMIATKTFHGTMFGSPPSYPKAARWALKMIERHRKAMRMLGGVVRT